MKNKSIIFCILINSVLVFLIGCNGKKENVTQTSTFQPPAVPPEVATSTATESGSEVKFAYRYRGEQFRDPFLPLVGESGRGAAPKRATEQLSNSNLNALILKGIMEDNEGKFALLMDSLGGSFVIKDGKLINQDGKIIPNVSGVIRKNKVMLIAPNTKIELTLKED